MGKLNNRLKKIFSLTRTQQIMFGVFLILISIIIFSSQISYFNTWRIDQSELSSFFDKTSQTVNIASKFGALISHFLIYMMFGVSSLIFSFLIFVSGLTLFVDANRKKLTERWFWGLIIMIWFSLFFGHFSTNYLYSGTIGYELNEFLNIYIGSIGIISILAFILISFLVIRLNITPEKIYLFIKKLIPKNKEPNKNKEEQTDIKESENEVVTSKFNFKNEEAKPTIQNFSSYAEKKVESRANEDDEIKIEIENNQNEEILDENEIAKGLVKKFGEYDHTLELKNFKPPSIELLNDYDNGGIITINEEELEENKEKIIDTLKNYKIGIDQIKATIGPTVTLYEIIPEAGIRISKIKNLEDDIALSLSALGIRIIAPIPGKGTIGIEVPNKNSTIVSMKSVLASKNYQEAEMELPIALGKNISNETYVVDLAKMPHLLMAGATGQGKSVGLNAVLTSLLYKKHPSEVKFVLVDPKKVELTLFNKIERHYLAKLPDTDEAIITDNKAVIKTLNSLCIEMDNRYEMLKNAMCRNIKEYNTKFKQRKLNPDSGNIFLPYIVLIIDEFADLIMTAGKEVETPIARLAQLARA